MLRPEFLGIVKQVLMLTGVGFCLVGCLLLDRTDFNLGPEAWVNEV